MAQSDPMAQIQARRDAIQKILRELSEKRAQLRQQQDAIAEALERNKTDFTLNQGALAMLDDLFPPAKDNGQEAVPPPPEEYVEVVRGTGV